MPSHMSQYMPSHCKLKTVQYKILFPKVGFTANWLLYRYGIQRAIQVSHPEKSTLSIDSLAIIAMTINLSQAKKYFPLTISQLFLL
jgi:hypothetical protein